MKTLNIEKVKQAVKAQKWLRSGYEYALSGMYTYYTNWSGYSKKEIIDMFYERVETHFRMISDYTTFRNIDCYDEPVSVDYSNLPQTKSFVITKDYYSSANGSELEFADATDEQKAQIKKDGFTVHFKLYDDDDNLYYGGYLKSSLEGTEAAFRPLDDYGLPNAGCSYITYREKDGSYSHL